LDICIYATDDNGLPFIIFLYIHTLFIIYYSSNKKYIYLQTIYHVLDIQFNIEIIYIMSILKYAHIIFKKFKYFINMYFELNLSGFCILYLLSISFKNTYLFTPVEFIFIKFRLNYPFLIVYDKPNRHFKIRIHTPVDVYIKQVIINIVT